MKTQLLQDIGESQPPSRSLPIRDTGYSDTRRTKEQRIEPEMHQPRSDSGFADGGTPASESAETEWPGNPPAKEPHWFDRWGRKAAMCGAGLAAVCIVAGGALWLYNESKVERTLAVLAQNSIPARQPGPGATPQMNVTLSEESIRAAAPLPATAIPSALPDDLVQPPPPEKNRVRLKPPLKAQNAPAEPETIGRSQLAETLRQCRIAGYHAEQCVQRKCSMTRYGLACRG
jgi:hypothetical protein